MKYDTETPTVLVEYQTLTANHERNVQTKFCCLYIYIYIIFLGVLEGVRGGGLVGVFSAQGFVYLNTSHLKLDFIPKRKRQLYMSKNIDIRVGD